MIASLLLLLAPVSGSREPQPPEPSSAPVSTSIHGAVVAPWSSRRGSVPKPHRSKSGSPRGPRLRAPHSVTPQDDGGLAHRGDVLPAEVVEGLANEVGQKVLGDVIQIHLLLDPRLLGMGEGEAKKQSLAKFLALEGTELPDPLLEALTRESDFGESTVHRLLNNVLDDYLNLFFRDVQRGSSLTRHIRGESAPALKQIYFTADLQAGSVVVEGEVRLRVKLNLSLVHIALQSEPPFAVHSLERLWSDRGFGESVLPPLNASGSLGVEEIDRAFRAACIDALRGGLALSLWGNGRLSKGKWTQRRPDVVGEPLTTSDNFRYRPGRKGGRR